MREHNRIATELKPRLGNTLSFVSSPDEFLFEETSYDPNTDPSILNEFATVAYRFGHSTVSDIFGQAPVSQPWLLRRHFLRPQDVFVVGSGGTNWMAEMQGAIVQPSPKNDLVLADALRNHLFDPPHNSLMILYQETFNE